MNYKNHFSLLFFLLLFSMLVSAQYRECGTIQHLDFLKSQDPLLEQKMQQEENDLQNWIQNQPEISSSTVLTIPVVVHIVYNNTNENISTSQIQSQIDILNEDFRRLNANASETREEFLPFAGDPQIEFYLATEDPDAS